MMHALRLIGFAASAALLLALGGCDSADDRCDDPCRPLCGPCFDPMRVKTIDSYPAWGPDGRTIAYTHYSGEPFDERGPDQIWLLDVETRERRFLTPGWDPAWSPDGTRLAYVIGALGGADIYVVEIETGEVRRLTEWGSSFSPSWSPDGEWITFDTNYGDPKGANVIWIMRADGSEKTDISEHGIGEWRHPDWCSTGEIVHLRYIDGVVFEEIFVMDSRGGNARRLTSDDRSDRHPACSPDGRRIAWDSYGSGDDPTSGIWVMDADGGSKRQITRYGGFPSWSPDGQRVVYYGLLEDPLASGSTYRPGVLFLMNADGSGKQQLTAPEDYEDYSRSDSARGAALRTY